MKTLVLLLFCWVLIVPFSVCSKTQKKDDPLAAELKRQLYSNGDNIRPLLHYPQSVMRFYRENDHSPVWLTTSGQVRAGKAMLLLDCVLQYGLMPKDYHPKELSYQLLAGLSDKPDTVTLSEKIRFEVMLTDAMITLIDQLHFGKLNPEYGQARLDAGMNIPLDAVQVLTASLNARYFEDALLNVQPNNRAYRDLQRWMYLWKGLYMGDCYDVPDSEIRHVAINMERLKWQEINDSTPHIGINIPSYLLTYQLPDTAYSFKVIVGKATTPTPVLNSQIAYFTTAPVWMVPQNVFVDDLLPKAIHDQAYLRQNRFGIFDRDGAIKNPDRDVLQQIQQSPAGFYAKQLSGKNNQLGTLVFRIQNFPSVYVRNIDERRFSALQDRALSNGPVFVQDAEQLARLLLKNDGGDKRIRQFVESIAKQTTRNFLLTRPVPLQVTYLTCEIKDGTLVSYPDVYDLDPALIASLYNEVQLITMK